MYGRRADLAEMATVQVTVGKAAEAVDVLFCPPAPLIAAAADLLRHGPIHVGAQNCAERPGFGAYTGEISAEIVVDVGARYVIVGHSERRGHYGETDAIVRRKAEAVLGAGAIPIICVGETEMVRRRGRALEEVSQQLTASLPREFAAGEGGPEIVVAYEPVWAVGSDRLPTPGEIQDVHEAARTALAALYGAETAQITRVLYGGSVNPRNAAEIFAIPGVDGSLVGRASLKAADYSALILAHPAVGQQRSGGSSGN